MKKITIIFTASIMLSCADQMPIKRNSSLFKDCIDYSYRPKCCLSFEIDSIYRRSENTFGASWETDKGYGFISQRDTISIALYIEEWRNTDTLLGNENNEDPQKGLRSILYHSYLCSIQDFVPLNFFFKGNYASCTGGVSSILWYSGRYYDTKTKHKIYLEIISRGPIITTEREEHFKQIIQSIKVEMTPR